MKAIHNLSAAQLQQVQLFVNPKLKELFDKWKQFTTKWSILRQLGSCLWIQN